MAKYPNIKELDPIIFTILRDPLETAISGVRFNIQNGWLKPDSDKDSLDKFFLSRSNYFANVFGIKNHEEIKVFKKFFWRSVDISNIRALLEDIYKKRGSFEDFKITDFSIKDYKIPNINVTSTNIKYSPSKEIEEQFLESSKLDYAIYKALT